MERVAVFETNLCHAQEQLTIAQANEAAMQIEINKSREDLTQVQFMDLQHKLQLTNHKYKEKDASALLHMIVHPVTVCKTILIYTHSKN